MLAACDRLHAEVEGQKVMNSARFQENEKLKADVEQLRNALRPFADPDNWETKTEYGPYGSYYVTTWRGEDRDIDDAKEAMEMSEREG